MSVWDIYAQYINSTGDNLWNDNCIAVCNADDYQWLPHLCTDGDGGVIITWQHGFIDKGDIYAQQVFSNGTLAWYSDSYYSSDNSDDDNGSSKTGESISGYVVYLLVASIGIASLFLIKKYKTLEWKKSHDPIK